MKSSGFSLLELTIVLACGVILLALAVPGVQQLHDEWILYGCARLLEQELQWGRTHAIATNGSLRLEVDPNGRSFYWVDPLSSNTFDHTVRNLPQPVRIARAPRRPLRFHPHGNAAPAGSYLLAGPAGSYLVVVNVVGRVRMQRMP